MASSLITSWQIDGEKVETVADYFGGLQNHCRWWLQPWNWKTLVPLEKRYNKPRQYIKKQIHHFTDKGLYGQSCGYSSNSHVWTYESNHKEGWNWKWGHSVVSNSAAAWTVAHEAPPSIEFSRQEYWSGLPFPSPRDLPDPGIEPGSPALQADAFTVWATREALKEGWEPKNWRFQVAL